MSLRTESTHSKINYDTLPSSDGLGKIIFGRFLRSVRGFMRSSQIEWSDKTGIPDSTLSRIELGDTSPPSRSNLEKMTKQLDLNSRQSDRLMVAAGYLPIFPFEAAEQDVDLITDALRELMQREGSKGYIEALKQKCSPEPNP